MISHGKKENHTARNSSNIGQNSNERNKSLLKHNGWNKLKEKNESAGQIKNLNSLEIKTKRAASVVDDCPSFYESFIKNISEWNLENFHKILKETFNWKKGNKYIDVFEEINKIRPKKSDGFVFTEDSIIFFNVIDEFLSGKTEAIIVDMDWLPLINNIIDRNVHDFVIEMCSLLQNKMTLWYSPEFNFGTMYDEPIEERFHEICSVNDDEDYKPFIDDYLEHSDGIVSGYSKIVNDCIVDIDDFYEKVKKYKTNDKFESLVLSWILLSENITRSDHTTYEMCFNPNDPMFQEISSLMPDSMIRFAWNWDSPLYQDINEYMMCHYQEAGMLPTISSLRYTQGSFKHADQYFESCKKWAMNLKEFMMRGVEINDYVFKFREKNGNNK